jgi:hypothetical protein
MPDFDGSLLASRLKDLAPHVPIFMISGEDQIPPEALRFVEEVMSKGEKPARFLSKVSELVTAGSALTHFLLMKGRAQVTHLARES